MELHIPIIFASTSFLLSIPPAIISFYMIIIEITDWGIQFVMLFSLMILSVNLQYVLYYIVNH